MLGCCKVPPKLLSDHNNPMVQLSKQASTQFTQLLESTKRKNIHQTNCTLRTNTAGLAVWCEQEKDGGKILIIWIKESLD